MAMLAILVLPLMYARLVGRRDRAALGCGVHRQSRPAWVFRDLYLFSSSTGNNGSAFGGMTGNTPFYNIDGAVAMFLGRFFMIIPALAIVSSPAAKKTVPASAGTFPTDGGLFVGLLVGAILLSAD